MDAEQRGLVEKLYLELYDIFLTYASLSLENDAQAEDAVQETFQIACQKIETLQESPNPQGWMYCTLKNVIRNVKHARANAARVIAYYQMVQEETCQEDSYSLETLYGNLTETEAFKLLKEYAIDKRSHYEMAQARGITVNACRKRLQRAKEFLRMKILE